MTSLLPKGLAALIWLALAAARLFPDRSVAVPLVSINADCFAQGECRAGRRNQAVSEAVHGEDGRRQAVFKDRHAQTGTPWSGRSFVVGVAQPKT